MKRHRTLIATAAMLTFVLIWQSGGRAGRGLGPVSLSSGDANGDGRFDISDPVHMLNYLFSGGDPPAPCQAQGLTPGSSVGFDPGVTSLQATNVQAALEELDARVQALASDGADLSIRVASLEGEVTVDLVPIPAGQFVMGSPDTEVGRRDDEPQHLVHITRPFQLGRTEVTQSQFRAVMGWNPSLFANCPDCPVENVNWYDATYFCEKLTERHRAEGTIQAPAFYRLPTEAEWEYACRAGTTTRFFFGDALECTASCPQANDYIWWGGNSDAAQYGPKSVGLKNPNPWGLYDILGNVSEWCSDRYGPLDHLEATDPQGSPEGINRVHRGGEFNRPLEFIRSAGWRFANQAHERGNIFFSIGFRVVLDSGA
jgi:formylglycine-generating enzyme required for sulfatase activity